MATTALVNVRTVREAASPQGYEQGEEWYAKGRVSGLEDADGGAVALVATDGTGPADGGGGPAAGGREVWVGIEGRALVAECDCAVHAPDPDTPAPDGLCAHAVAVALAALDAGIRWTPAPSAMPEWTDPMEAFQTLDAYEEAKVLHALLREQPELRERAWQLAVSVLSAAGAPGGGADGAEQATRELRASTATAVREALEALDAADMRPGEPEPEDTVDGSTPEQRAAGRLVRAALEPFEQDVVRRLGLGLGEAAQAVALGLIDGLAACGGDLDRSQALYFAADDLAGAHAQRVRQLLQEGGAPLPETAG